MLRSINQAAEIIKNGGIVAFPTETVYGLGADAFNADAVFRIYQAKGRPGDNPLILHVNNIEMAETLTLPLSAKTKQLMDAFWPGPFTLVLQKKPGLPAWVGGHPQGLMETVALRSPSNGMARELIALSGCVIAAPSANKAGTPSPTKAAHVAADFLIPGEVDFLLDGGPAEGGLESTVVDMTDDIPRILRPGAVTLDMLKAITGEGAYVETVQDAPRSPGQKYKHYAPKAPVTIVMGPMENILSTACAQLKIGVLTTQETESIYLSFTPHVLSMGNREDLFAIARNLYTCLRRFDELGVDAIYAEAIPETGLGRAIMNRLLKAAEGRVIHG